MAKRLAKLTRIGIGHVHETRPAFGHCSSEWVFAHQINVVGNVHEITDVKIIRYSAGGIGQNQALNSHRSHQPHRECNHFHRVSLVIVQTPGLHQDLQTRKPTDNELPRVPLYGTRRHPWQMIKLHLGINIEFIHHAAERTA